MAFAPGSPADALALGVFEAKRGPRKETEVRLVWLRQVHNSLKHRPFTEMPVWGNNPTVVQGPPAARLLQCPLISDQLRPL